MVDLRPFPGLRFNPACTPDLGQVISPPYDVISPTEQAQLHARSPYNIVRLELGLDQPGDDEGHNRYTRAAETLDQWRREGALLQDRRPAFYLHHEQFRLGEDWRERRDLIATVRLSDWSESQVLPHEKTMPKPKADRFRLLQATATEISPVWSLYRERSLALERAWQLGLQREPEQCFVDDEGREHRLWVLDEPELQSAIVRDFSSQKLYIADGHHRYETALHYRNERRGAERASRRVASTSASDVPYEFVLMVLTQAEDSGLVVLPTHRIVHAEQGLDAETVREKLSPHLRLEQYAVAQDVPLEAVATLIEKMARASGQHAMGLYGPDPGVFTVLSARDEQTLEAMPRGAFRAWRELDVAVAQALVIQPLLGSADLHQAIAYTRDPVEAFRTVREGRAQLALFLKPTRIEQVLAVADAGERMPEKSTYFYPKPPTGLVLYPLDRTAEG